MRMKLLVIGLTCLVAGCSINRPAGPDNSGLLNQCVESIRPFLLAETSCPGGIGPPARSCERPLRFIDPPVAGFAWPPNATAYEADPLRWQEVIIGRTAKANENYTYRVHKVLGVLPVGQRIRITEIREFASNWFEMGVYWAAIGVLDGGAFAGHTIRIPSGADGEAWIMPAGAAGSPFSHMPSPVLVSSMVRQCEN
jgi:hypothetical protein